MRAWSVFRKSLQEQRRDLLVLLLTLSFAPLMVVLYYLFFPGGSTAYTVLILNLDAGYPLADGSRLAGGEQLAQAIGAVTYANGDPLLKATMVDDRAEAERLLRDRKAAAMLIVPVDFSRSIHAARGGDGSSTTAITLVGDLTNPYYAVAAVLASSAVESYVQQAIGERAFLQYLEEPLGASAARSEFETYVPGVLIFAAILLVFQSSMAVAREVEAGTLRRLRLTRMTAFDLFGGVTATQVLIGVAAVILTLLTAQALGFRSRGPLWIVIVIGALTCLSIVGVGLMVACFSKTVSQAFVIANFPLALFMFFTGAAFPIPAVPLFSVAGRAIGLYDILPPTHAVVALNKVMSLGVGVEEIAYELAALGVLSTAYFAFGVWLFQRRHLSKGVG
jgi:ABC-2 type transport system permease protein